MDRSELEAYVKELEDKLAVFDGFRAIYGVTPYANDGDPLVRIV